MVLRTITGTAPGQTTITSWPGRVGDSRTQSIGALRPKLIGQLRSRVISVRHTFGVASSAGAATTTGSFFGKRQVQGTATGVAGVGALLSARRAVSGLGHGTVSVAATLSVRRTLIGISGTASGRASMSSWPGRIADYRTRTIGSLRPRLISQLRSQVISVRHALVASSAGLAAVVATIGKAGSFAVRSAGRASVAAILSVRHVLGGTTGVSSGRAATSSWPGRIADYRPRTIGSLRPTLIGQLRSRGISVRRSLAASSAGVATTVALFRRRAGFFLLSAGQTTFSSWPGRIGDYRTRTIGSLRPKLISQLRSRVISVRHSLAVSGAAGVASTVGVLGKVGSLAVLSAGRANVAASLSVRRHSNGLSAGTATASGVLRRSRMLLGRGAGVAATSSTISSFSNVTYVYWSDDFQFVTVGADFVRWRPDPTRQFQLEGDWMIITWDPVGGHFVPVGSPYAHAE